MPVSVMLRSAFQVGTMIHSLLRRGIDDGTLRTD